ncbi:glycine--tRNA ligase subunit beta [Qipengyuania sp. DY56-A-20]|uniref:Glycine--tRNA ligase beta subunit n=1 Tax=Qipengyuania benthica TaxID=3067651 RepID=A0ABT9H7I6_9SPHN|nr:glycine--tRNA ligase subunit beta [Qipengyuania sp. DY56-A-20]MDP4539279.1 glycine--tRNA ligase subunit beta [Qipengyuania sp. DY56-A-20]
MPDFLLELRSEEIPARMQAGARSELEKLFRREMDAAGITPGAITVWSTPRRLALIARDLPQATQAVSEEAKGPPEGAPDAALDGFCRKNDVTRDQLTLRDVKGRNTWFAVIEKPGRATADLLAQAIPAIVRDFSWPKSMRWGAASIGTESLRWVRPLSGIVALLGEELIECEVHGVTSGWVTLGHRFHHAGDITIGSADDYAEKLRACHVIVDHEERAALIRKGAQEVAEKAGLELVEDEGLVVENAGLTEWPVPLLGRFEEAFLEVPPEVIQLTARVNQKYFVCNSPLPLAGGVGGGPDATPDLPTPQPPPAGGRGSLANAFVCTANIAAEDGGARVVDGNRKVLAARLSDARFFWDVDRKRTLAQHAEGLERITFHEKLGTVADKVERVAKLARWLVEEGVVKPHSVTPHPVIPHPVTPAKAGVHASDSADGTMDSGLRRNDEDVAELADLAEQAALLCKADLVTEMVGEFPELQGLMGGYYARAEGLPDAVADAIRDHYKPVGQGDEVPTAPVTVAVSLADKLDTLVGFFAISEKPTGSKDPFALRRAALGIIRLLQAGQISAGVLRLVRESYAQFAYDGDRKWYLYKVIADGGFGGIAALRERLPSMVDDDLWLFDLPADHEGFQPPYDEEQLVAYSEARFAASSACAADLLDFFADRLKVQEREAGVRHDLVDAVFSLGGEDDLVRLLARVKALQNYVETAEGANLLAAYKRAANILKKEDWHGCEGEIARTGEEDPLALVDDPDLKAVIDAKMAERHQKELSYTPEPAEKTLIEALDQAEPKAAAAIEGEDFETAMAALASLRAPIDRFFEEVTVNDADEDKRAARLDLLARFRAAVHKAADFARIEG